MTFTRFLVLLFAISLGLPSVLAEKAFRLTAPNDLNDCDGMLTLRHGNRNIVDGNFFFGGGKPNSGGIRAIGEDHVITNNYIAGMKKGGVWLTSGVPDSKPPNTIR